MIFVDSNVLLAAVGPEGPERRDAQGFFLQTLERRIPLCTSALAVLEVMDLCDRDRRLSRTDTVLKLVQGRFARVWPLEIEDLLHAHDRRTGFGHLVERDLVKLAACRRRGVGGVKTYEMPLRAAFKLGRRGYTRTARELAEAFQAAWEEERLRDACV